MTKVTSLGATGVFTINVTGLAQNTGYSFKAYAINSRGNDLHLASVHLHHAGGGTTDRNKDRRFRGELHQPDECGRLV